MRQIIFNIENDGVAREVFNMLCSSGTLQSLTESLHRNIGVTPRIEINEEKYVFLITLPEEPIPQIIPRQRQRVPLGIEQAGFSYPIVNDFRDLEPIIHHNWDNTRRIFSNDEVREEARRIFEMQNTARANRPISMTPYNG